MAIFGPPLFRATSSGTRTLSFLVIEYLFQCTGSYVRKPTASSQIEAEILFIASVNRTDWMARPRLVWTFQPNWRVIFGVDVFDGPPLGFFGQYANRDRAYTELRYSF